MVRVWGMESPHILV